MLRIQKVKALGLQKLALKEPLARLGKGMVDWIGQVRLG